MGYYQDYWHWNLSHYCQIGPHLINCCTLSVFQRSNGSKGGCSKPDKLPLARKREMSVDGIYTLDRASERMARRRGYLIYFLL